MTTHLRIIVFLAAVVAVVPCQAQDEPSTAAPAVAPALTDAPLDIRQVITQTSWSDYSAEMSMEVQRYGSSRVSTKEMSVKVKQDQSGDQHLFMIFKEPANMKGTAFLAHSMKDRSDQWYVYVRTLRRVKRAPPSPENFMLRDFLSLYLQKPRPEMYSYTDQGPATVDGRPCRILEGRAVDDKTTVMTAYTRIVHYVDPADKLIVKTEFFGKGDRLVRVQKVTRTTRVNGIVLPLTYESDDKEEKVVARVTMHGITLDSGIPDHLFSVRHLKTL